MSGPHASPHRSAALLAAISLAVLLMIVLPGGPRPTRDRPDRGGVGAGATGIEPPGPIPVEPGTEPGAPPGARRLRSPAGRLIERGTRDALGYVLPLDVRRPRPERPRPAPPARAGIEAARASTGAGGGGAAGPLAAFGAPFVEHRLGPDDGHTQNETSIDAHGDTVVAGWNNYTGTTLVMGVARSTDGGDTWSWDLFGGHTAFSDPAVKAGRNGKWYYCYIATGGAGGSDFDVYVRRSLDGGATWAAPVPVTANATFDDKPYMDARGDEVLVGYADFGFSPARVRAARSTDGGMTFGNDTVLAVNSGGGNGACPVIDAAGTYYMFWRDSFQDSLWVSRSTDQGTTWSPDRGIAPMHPLPSSYPPGYRIVNLPSAGADPLTGDLVVVWNDQLLGNPDILSIRSTDGGQSWSAPVRVNDDAGTAVQFFPWVTFDETGIVHVVWYDRREDGFDIDVYTARSLDGGQTYEANVRVTAAPFEPILPWDTGVQFIGDYNGIAATATAVYPFYQDSREGNQDVWVAVLPGGGSTGIAEGGSGGGGGAGSDAGGHGGGGAPPAAGAAMLVAAPNPFRAATVLRAVAGGAGGDPAAGRPAARAARSIEIISAGGRRLRRLALDAGGTVTWDGRDAAGRALPRGIYFARLTGEGLNAAARRAPAARLVKLE